TGACWLGAQDAQERRPPRIADALGETVVLEPVGRLQILVIDHSVGSDQGQRCLVVKLLAAYRLMGLRPQLHRFTPAIAAPLSSGDSALGCLQCALSLAIPAWRKDALATGQRGEGFQAEVYARLVYTL